MIYETRSKKERKLNLGINRKNIEVILNPSEKLLEITKSSLNPDHPMYDAEFLVKGIGAYDGHVTYLFTKTKHVCGLMGYNPMLGDECDGCNESAEYSRIMDKTFDKLKKLRLLRRA